MDPTYILVVIGVVISLLASAKVKATFSKYSRVRALSGMRAEEVAQMILHSAGIDYVKIEHISGSLTDHYDPKAKVLRLSDSVYGSNSVAAIGVAAHECGHAVQDEEQYGPLVIRSMSVPVVNFGSRFSIPLLILGFILTEISMSFSFLIPIALFLFGLTVLFTLITLPVEFNASHRAIRVLKDSGALQKEEVDGAKNVLKAAAMTYVASAVSSILQLLRWILISRSRRR